MNVYHKLVNANHVELLLNHVYYMIAAFYEPISWCTYMCVLQVLSTLFALPCPVTCRGERMFMHNTFLALNTLRSKHRQPILHHALSPAYTISP